MENPKYDSYSVLEPCPDGKTVAIGNINGDITLIHEGEENPLQSVSELQGESITSYYRDFRNT